MGRHSKELESSTKGKGGIALLSAIAVVALVLVGLGVRALVSSDPSTAQDQASSQQDSGETESAEDDGGDREQPDMGGGEGSQESDAAEDTGDAEVVSDADTEQEVEDQDAPEALARCHARVAAGNEWAAVTAVSASNWKQHYMASARYNSGEISLEQAEAEFAESKAAGQDDMRNVSAAASEYSQLAGACDEMSVDDMPEQWSQVAQQCLDRSEAIDEVVATGTEVNSDWSHHLEMMRNKDDVDPDVYYDRWRDMVDAAPAAMDPYEDAADELEDAPACSV